MPTDPTEDCKPHKTCLACDGGFTHTSGNDLTNTANAEKGEIIEFLWKMKIENYSEETIERYGRALVTLASRGADLNNSESVKEIIARQNWSDGTKQNTTNAIRLYYKFNGIKASLPSYTRQDKIPFIPTESEIDQLISATKHQLATFLQVLKETGARYGEVFNLKWKDYDTERATLSITPEKGSNPRAPRISTKLQAMINQLPRNSTRIFDYKDKRTPRKSFERLRKRVAENTGNPRILQIHLHTLRHWKATVEFHKTNNVILVMKLLGHKCLNNTQRYIQLLPELSDDFDCEVAHNIQEVVKLVEAGIHFCADNRRRAHLQETQISHNSLFFICLVSRAITYDGTNRGASHTKLAPVNFSSYPIVTHGETRTGKSPIRRELGLEERSAPQ